MKINELKEPFPAKDIEWRVARAGQSNGKVWCMVLAYLTSRAVMDRLDAVCGPENWRNEFQPAPGGGVMCGISIKIGDEWVTKWDGAENTDIEAVKGGLSGAMKRAAVQWGIGRYLYKLDETFAEAKTEKERGWNYARLPKNQGGTVFYWQTPNLPNWALPAGQGATGENFTDEDFMPEPSRKWLEEFKAIATAKPLDTNAVLAREASYSSVKDHFTSDQRSWIEGFFKKTRKEVA